MHLDVENDFRVDHRRGRVDADEDVGVHVLLAHRRVEARDDRRRVGRQQRFGVEQRPNNASLDVLSEQLGLKNSASVRRATVNVGEVLKLTVAASKSSVFRTFNNYLKFEIKNKYVFN